MKEIKLIGKHGTLIGNCAQVSDEDYECLNQRKWHGVKYKNDTYYTKSNNIFMHRLILGISNPKIFVDHIDGNGLNNQRSNLRIATCSQNGANRKKTKSKSSKYLGVCRIKSCNNSYWRAQCRNTKVSVKKYEIIYCKTELEAALIYNKMAIKYHGEFAKLNNIVTE